MIASTKVDDLTVKSKIDGVVVKITKDVAKAEGGSQEPVIHIISNQPFKVKGKCIRIRYNQYSA